MAICGCQSVHDPRPALLAVAPESDAVQPRPLSEFVERITIEGDLVLAVRVPREAVVGAPINVSTELANRGTRPILLTYSQQVRAVWPAVWFNRSGTMPLTREGRRMFGNRDETWNDTHEIAPGKIWTLTFDINDYYELKLADHTYSLAVRCEPQWIDSTTKERTGTTLEVSGIPFRVVRPAVGN
jgi:hypothetical protein